ncbi:MAG: hypothetical protein AAF681_12940 [Pseudomonadota bacterium]
MGQVDFQDRIARLNDKHGAAAVTTVSSENTVRAVEKRSRNFDTSEDTLAGRLAYPLSFVTAFLFGILSVFIGRFAFAHLGGPMQDGDAMTLYIVDLALAGAMAFAINLALKSGEKEKVSVSMVGVFASVSLMHNLIWMYPDTAAVIYGQAWVDGLMGRSMPNSFYFQGEYIPFD